MKGALQGKLLLSLGLSLAWERQSLLESARPQDAQHHKIQKVKNMIDTELEQMVFPSTGLVLRQ